MARLKIPYQPLRTSLYSPAELYAGFVPERPPSAAETLDFRVYRHFISRGRGVDADYFETMMESLHDNSVTQALEVRLAGEKCVALMGGHKLARDSREYRDAARLGRELTRAGLLVVTGGGPGAMEAAHLGASLAQEEPAVLESFLGRLAGAPSLPQLKDVVRRDGTVDEDLVGRLHGWLAPALALAAEVPRPGASIGVPTWFYGHEPATPFATHAAKYFQNSIREEGLLALAHYGVVFVRGRAGTLQEIFQDAAQNYYETVLWASPMVLFGAAYWTTELPAVPLLRRLFGEERFALLVRVTDDVAEAVAFLAGFKPPGAA